MAFVCPVFVNSVTSLFIHYAVPLYVRFQGSDFGLQIRHGCCKCCDSGVGKRYLDIVMTTQWQEKRDLSPVCFRCVPNWL